MQPQEPARMARAQILPVKELSAYLFFVATLPEGKDGFVERLSLTPEAAEMMDTDIEDIMSIVANMRYSCSKFQDETFYSIVSLVSRISQYATTAQGRHPDWYKYIESLRKTVDIDQREEIVQLLRFLVEEERRQLNSGITSAQEYDRGISKFQVNIQSHKRQIEDELRAQDWRLENEVQGDSGNLTSHVKVIEEKLEEVANSRATFRDEIEAGTLNEALGSPTYEETIWVDFIGMVPKSIFEHESCQVSHQRIMNAVQDQDPAIAGERLWLYRALIMRGLSEIQGRIESASKAVGALRGVFENFQSGMKGVVESLERLSCSEASNPLATVPAIFLKHDEKDLANLVDAAKLFATDVSCTSDVLRILVFSACTP